LASLGLGSVRKDGTSHTEAQANRGNQDSLLTHKLIPEHHFDTSHPSLAYRILMTIAWGSSQANQIKDSGQPLDVLWDEYRFNGRLFPRRTDRREPMEKNEVTNRRVAEACGSPNCNVRLQVPCFGGDATHTLLLINAF
jgi:hypothetical protein